MEILNADIYLKMSTSEITFICECIKDTLKHKVLSETSERDFLDMNKTALDIIDLLDRDLFDEFIEELSSIISNKN